MIRRKCLHFFSWNTRPRTRCYEISHKALTKTFSRQRTLYLKFGVLHVNLKHKIPAFARWEAIFSKWWKFMSPPAPCVRTTAAPDQELEQGTLITPSKWRSSTGIDTLTYKIKELELVYVLSIIVLLTLRRAISKRWIPLHTTVANEVVSVFGKAVVANIITQEAQQDGQLLLFPAFLFFLFFLFSFLRSIFFLFLLLPVTLLHLSFQLLSCLDLFASKRIPLSFIPHFSAVILFLL